MNCKSVMHSKLAQVKKLRNIYLLLCSFHELLVTFSTIKVSVGTGVS